MWTVRTIDVMHVVEACDDVDEAAWMVPVIYVVCGMALMRY